MSTDQARIARHAGQTKRERAERLLAIYDDVVDQADRARTWWTQIADYAEATLETSGLDGLERRQAEQAVDALNRGARRATRLAPQSAQDDASDE